MKYSEEQIKFIQENYPDFGFKVVPSLDSVVVEFLKKYEVYVTPTTSSSKNTGGNALAGAITGMAGADVGGDAFLISGQDKQTKVQEWIQWKQWALNHKDFEDFRVIKIENPKSHNLKVLEKLKKPEIQKELEPLMEEFEELEHFEGKKLNRMGPAKYLFLSVIFVPVAFALVSAIQEWVEEESYSYIETNLVQRL